MGNFERIYPDDDPHRQATYERVLDKAAAVFANCTATRRTSSTAAAAAALAAKQQERLGTLGAKPSKKQCKQTAPAAAPASSIDVTTLNAVSDGAPGCLVAAAAAACAPVFAASVQPMCGERPEGARAPQGATFAPLEVLSGAGSDGCERGGAMAAGTSYIGLATCASCACARTLAAPPSALLQELAAPAEHDGAWHRSFWLLLSTSPPVCR